jgi:diguanylate cyclase (GGDEF)-like protein/PAS domain S-box-containing protein
LCWCYLILNVALVTAVFLLPRYHVYLWGLLGLGSAGAIVTGVIRNRPKRLLAWVFVTLGVFTFALGDITYDVLTEFLHESNPFPSIADAFYVATYVFLAAGLTTMVRTRRRRDGDTGALLDALIITSGLAVLSWVYLIEPYVRAANMTSFSKATSIAYPLGDILLLSVVARLAFGDGTHNTSQRLLTIGVVGVLAADAAYGWIQLHGDWKVGGPADFGWVLFYVCWGAAALHPAMREMTVEQPRRVRPLNWFTLALLGAAALAAPLLLIWRDLTGTPTDAGVLASGSAVVFVLVMLRLTGLARAQASNAHHEQVLRSFSEQLVAANERADVWNASVAAVVAIGASGVLGCVVTSGGTTVEEIVAASWAELIGVAITLGGCERPGDDRTIHLPAGYVRPEATWTELKVSHDDEVGERIMIAHDGPFPLGLRAILDGIAAQLILALARVELARVVNESRTARKFQSMVQHSSDLITLLGADQRVVYQSAAVLAVLGRSPEETVGHLLNEFIHPEDVQTVQAQFTKILTGGQGATTTFEYRVTHVDGQWRNVDAVITNLLDEPDVSAIVLNGRDVTDRRALELELVHQAFHDTLTGLANRSLFLDRLSHAMDRGDRRAEPIAVLFMDLDDFKTVNDSLGHPVGDHLLIAVAERLRMAIRPGDTVARFGGDEFAVLVESGTMPDAAEAVATRITEALLPSFRVRDNNVTVRASIGIALGRRPQESPDDLLRDADLAMYLAKHNGKGRFEMYRPDMHTEAVHRLETAAELRIGLEAKQFEVVYQPIVDTHSGGLLGAEALVRWRHPSRGLLAPIEFIPIAEATGLIVPLGRQVLQEATRQARAWQDSGLTSDDFYVSVNVSALQLREPGLVDDVSRALEDSGLAPAVLVLEVTESTLVENLDLTLPHLHALRSLGLRIAVDDFGTGYSSLSYLGDLPVSIVKIDKSFIDRITPDAEGSALVRGVIDLSRALGFTCIAEGVELDSQLSVLDSLGCDSVQGYLFARPASALEIGDTLARLRLDQTIPPLPISR